MEPPRLFVRFAVTAFQTMRRAWWFVARPRVEGVLAVPLTPEGKVVLVRLTYDSGWHLPGGGVKRGENAEAAVLRELTEEIGMTGNGAVICVRAFEHRPDRRRGVSTLFRVDGVIYAPKRSIEVEEIGEFDPDGLPDGTTRMTREKVAEVLRPV